MTPELLQNGKPDQHSSIEEIADILTPLLIGLDGLTLSGGEPTLQSSALTSLIRLLRQQKGSEEQEVLSYSGYSWEELSERGAEVAEFLSELGSLLMVVSSKTPVTTSSGAVLIISMCFFSLRAR